MGASHQSDISAISNEAVPGLVAAARFLASAHLNLAIFGAASRHGVEGIQQWAPPQRGAVGAKGLRNLAQTRLEHGVALGQRSGQQPGQDGRGGAFEADQLRAIDFQQARDAAQRIGDRGVGIGSGQREEPGRQLRQQTFESDIPRWRRAGNAGVGQIRHRADRR